MTLVPDELRAKRSSRRSLERRPVTDLQPVALLTESTNKGLPNNCVHAANWEKDLAIAAAEAATTAGVRLSDLASMVVGTSGPAPDVSRLRQGMRAAHWPEDPAVFVVRKASKGSVEPLHFAVQSVRSGAAEIVIAVGLGGGEIFFAFVCSSRYLVQAARSPQLYIASAVTAGWAEDDLAATSYEAIVRWCMLNTLDPDELELVALRVDHFVDLRTIADRLRLDPVSILQRSSFSELLPALVESRAASDSPVIVCDVAHIGQAIVFAIEL